MGGKRAQQPPSTSHRLILPSRSLSYTLSVPPPQGRHPTRDDRAQTSPAERAPNRQRKLLAEKVWPRVLKGRKELNFKCL